MTDTSKTDRQNLAAFFTARADEQHDAQKAQLIRQLAAACASGALTAHTALVAYRTI